MNLKSIIKLIILILSCTLFSASVWYLIDHFQWHQALIYLRQTNFTKLISLVLIIHFVFLSIRTWRMLAVVKQSNPTITFFDLYWVTAITVSLSILTPGQSGEMLKLELFKRQGLFGRLHGFGSFIVERILDLMVVAGMSLFGLIYGSGLSKLYPKIEVGTFILFFACVFILIIVWRINATKLSPWLKKIYDGSGSPFVWVKMFLLTIASWCLISFGWQVTLSMIDIHLSLPQTLWLCTSITLVTILSFIPGGMGVSDVLTVQVLLSLGVPNVTAQAGALILRLYALIVIFSGLGHLIWWLMFQRIKSDLR
jgi:uncharacterized membrane protein YbhN (UPF0104 family)